MIYYATTPFALLGNPPLSITRELKADSFNFVPQIRLPFHFRGAFISSVMVPQLLAEIGSALEPTEKETALLTPRETEILQLITEGLTNREIGRGYLSR